MTTAEGAVGTDADALIEELRRADGAYREAVDAVDRIGEADLERLSEAYESFVDLLDRYEEPASGSGRETFEAYIEFESELVDFVSALDEDLPRREAFERAESRLDKRRLSTSDFEAARDELGPVVERVAVLERRSSARERYREARRAVVDGVESVRRRLDELEAVMRFGSVDLDAPVGDLREPVEAYDRAVREAFRTYLVEAPSRDVLRFVRRTEAYPLVGFEAPPGRLVDFLEAEPLGEEPVGRLLELTDFSASKLDHYVPDAREFRSAVAANRAYLARLDAGPLVVGWPPPPAAELRWRLRELIAVVDRFAPDPVVERLHELRDLARDVDRYAELREAARAADRLDDETRRRLASGDLEAEHAALERERDRLEAALSEHPSR